VLPDDPETLNIPADPPPTPEVANLWKDWVQPLSMGSTAVAVAGLGVLGVIARKNHLAEMKEIEGKQDASVSAGAAEGGHDDA
jgi:hypothetical protein